MAKSAVDKVTGAGAKYVAAGRKAQEKAQVRSMAQNWTGRNATPSTSIPAHSEITPTPTHIAPTGAEHLSPAMFSPPKMSMHPGGGGATVNPVGPRPSKMSMHPGGGRMYTPTVKVPLSAGSYGGNIAPNAPRGMRSLPSSPSRVSSSGSSSSTTGSTGKKRGNASPAVLKATGGKSKMRTAVKNKASKSKTGSKVLTAIHIVKQSFGQHAGKNAENLRKATGA